MEKLVEKLDKLPEHVRKQVLHELTISKICETLKDPEIVTDRLLVHLRYTVDKVLGLRIVSLLACA